MGWRQDYWNPMSIGNETGARENKKNVENQVSEGNQIIK